MPDDTVVSCAKMAEPIEMPFGLWPWVAQENVLDVGARCWRHLLNTTAPSTCAGDAAFCQITLTTRYYYSHLLY